MTKSNTTKAHDSAVRPKSKPAASQKSRKRLQPGQVMYTDYPIVGLGDEPGEIAPWRQVTVESYDGNKYAKVKTCCGHEFAVKVGYLHVALPDEDAV